MTERDLLRTPQLEFSYELRETSRLLLDVLKRRIAIHKITLTQFFLMRQLWEEEGVSQVVLSERLQTTTAATVPLIDGLEKRGLLKRVRDERDRRVTRIYLTAKGRTLRGKLLGYAYDISSQALTGFDARSVAAFRRLLSEVRTNLSDADAEQAAG